MLNLIVFLTALAQGIVALFVYQKNRHNLSNISFGLLSCASLAWAITNYAYTLNPVSDHALVIIRLVLLMVVIQNTIFYIFARTYPSASPVISAKTMKRLLFLSFLTACAVMGPFVFKSVTVSYNQSNPNPGPLIPIFVAHAIFTIGAGLRSLIKKMHKATSKQRKQLAFIIFASVLTTCVVPITNFVITLVFHTTFFAQVSPFYTLAFAGIIAYAIVAQKLFDIRAAVARSVAYILMIGTIAAVYSIGVFGVINVLFAGVNHELLRQLLSVVLVIPLILSFQTIKRFFDRITSQIFYRDNYDNQEVLDKLGSLIVAEIDLHKVLRESRVVLSDALKSSFVEFILFEEDKPIFEAGNKKRVEENMDALIEHIKEQTKDILVTDELKPSSPFHQWFVEDHISVSLRLKTQHQVVGFVLFGEKLSGDVYNTQDKQLLAIVANELAVTVQNALRFEEIQTFNTTLQEKIDEATRQLRRTNEKLKTLDETKDEFISMASHQLRTPLTSIKGYVSMVIEGDVGKITEPQKKLLDQAFLSSQRMVYLIADLLNVSRLHTGKFIIERVPSNLADVIESELVQLKETAAARQIALNYDKPKDFPTLLLDETKTRQVVMNFLDNAIYYGNNGGHIGVALKDTGQSIEFTVTDDGIGVPKSEQHHLFTKFYRAENARKARPDGTGLGLYMAQKVILAQGGAIIFKSQEGKGSTFGFTFPKAKLLASVAEQPLASK